jgi:hypothetical protein
MDTRGVLRIDLGSLDVDGAAGEIEIVVLYTEWAVTRAVLERVVGLTAGLNVAITLVAVHTIPYPATFECPTAVHAHLVEQLVDLASNCPLSVHPQVVLARSREEGFRHVLRPESFTPSTWSWKGPAEPCPQCKTPL